MYRFSVVANVSADPSRFLLVECMEQIEPDNPKEICCIAQSARRLRCEGCHSSAPCIPLAVSVSSISSSLCSSPLSCEIEAGACCYSPRKCTFYRAQTEQRSMLEEPGCCASSHQQPKCTAQEARAPAKQRPRTHPRNYSTTTQVGSQASFLNYPWLKQGETTRTAKKTPTCASLLTKKMAQVCPQHRFFIL